ncbi:hypothetical protein ABIB38_002917 [Massilia sp. UYP11]|uniref:hypothetical protein n=1 Tax=Massilia sp. UYP11 TaxID=1756385 RepID=UPI003D1949A8
MDLPDLSTQILYGRLGWAIVLATLVCALWRRSAPMSRVALAAVLALALAAMALPGALSPAWWLGLAFQYPSGLLVGCCLLRLAERWRGIRRSQVMPQALAGVLAVGGALLYLDAVGLLARGFYYAGFGQGAAPLFGIVAAIACVLAIVRGHARAPAASLLGALALFALLRLPTGNLWDALVDPLLWAWAVAALLAAALRRAGRRAADRLPESEPDPAPTRALQPLAAEHFSSLKE